ncbi:MAG: hypothetical protein AABO58_16405 [Acidobacteriota bacterium]
MKRFIGSLVSLLLVLLIGCASGGGIAPNRGEISKLKDSGSAVRAITYTPAPFVLMSAGKVAAGSLFGIVGGAVAGNSMQKAGQEMIAAYAVEDPAVAVRDRVAGTLASEFGLEPAADTAPASDALPDLKGRFGDGTVLDTRTLGWQLIYYPSDWSHHYLIYAGRARLLRLSDGKVLWENRCFRKLPDPKGSRRTVDEYRANNGELLKQKVQEAGAGCAEELIAHLTGRPAVAR